MKTKFKIGDVVCNEYDEPMELIDIHEVGSRGTQMYTFKIIHGEQNSLFTISAKVFDRRFK